MNFSFVYNKKIKRRKIETAQKNNRQVHQPAKNINHIHLGFITFLCKQHPHTDISLPRFHDLPRVKVTKINQIFYYLHILPRYNI